MYISFVGFIQEPENIETLQYTYLMGMQEVFLGENSHQEEVYDWKPTGFRDGLKYEVIGGQDSLTVYLATIDQNTGHLVADCPEGGWVNDCFCVLDAEGNPVKENQFNPNPVEQVI